MPDIPAGIDIGGSDDGTPTGPQQLSAPSSREARGGNVSAVASRLKPEFLKGQRAYLVGTSCYLPPKEDFVHKTFLINAIRKSGYFNEVALSFMEKVLDASGLAEKTALHQNILRMQDLSYTPSYSDILSETETIFEDIVGDLLKKTNTRPDEVDAVITSCSCFAPMPSLAALVVHRFGMRKDVQTYSLAGMGCGASVVCVDMAARLLATLPKGAKIIIVTHENVSQGWYIGNDRSMLLVNCLFRAGGAAALMTNTKRGTGARYMLEHCERTHWACTQEGYDCMGDGEDADGKKGHFIRRSLLPVATDAIKFHLKRLAPHVLTWGELRKAAKDPKYVPRFGKGFEHLLLHTGGPAILEAMAGTLGLSKDEISASRETLQRFGNTSAASTFYTLAHRETLGGVRKGDRLWQLGLGGAFKCNSAIWRAVRNVSEAHPCWAEGVGAVEESELAEIARWRAENAAAAEDAVRRGLVAAPKAPGTGGGFNALAKLDALGAASSGDATVAASSADTSTEETEVTTSGSGGKIGRGKKVADVPARPVSAAAVAEA